MKLWKTITITARMIGHRMVLLQCGIDRDGHPCNGYTVISKNPQTGEQASDWFTSFDAACTYFMHPASAVQ